MIYSVSASITVDARTPEEAARMLRESMLGLHTIITTTVTDKCGRQTNVKTSLDSDRKVKFWPLD